MTVGSIGGYDYYNNYNYYNTAFNNGASSATGLSDEQKPNANAIGEDEKKPGAIDDGKNKTGRTSPEDCQTCKERKYQDGSDEADVSFKTASHVSPEAAGSAVRAHEGMHVSNAYEKAAKNNGKVINASVSIHTAVCPECGRTYVSGGTTHTQIKYYNESNPYQKDLKSADASKYRGANVDLSA